jgi:putative protease
MSSPLVVAPRERQPLPNGHTRIEILAPAGAPEALTAAVNNGADAVYLGLGELNARRGAANFDLETLAEGARFAHLRGARIYLTANVVVLAEELPSALSMIDRAWATGVDAVIVQDLGLLRALRASLPHVRVHASTQIDAMNPDAVLALAEAGVSRVTLARELSLEGIAACAATGVEVETFVHGALCYCYSGQCLMSSLIGRRSANRGLCAQPCRLPYELRSADGQAFEAPGRYLLSTRDLAGIEHLPALAAAGVRALKIEGRMKSAEYVAIVTGVYRAALDRALADPDSYSVLPAEWDMLEEAFSRGFTDGYLTDKRGADLMSYSRPNNRGVLVGRVAEGGAGRALVALDRAIDPGDTLEVWTRSGRFAQPAGQLLVEGRSVATAPAGEVVQLRLEQPAATGDRIFRVANATLSQAARRTYSGGAAIDHRATKVDIEVRVRIGKPLRMAVHADGASVSIDGAPVEQARTRPVTAEDVVEHVGRLGGSGYKPGSWSLDLDAEAGLGFSALHALRREALERLDEARLVAWAGRSLSNPDVPRLPAPAPRTSRPELVASVWDLDAALDCLSAGADRVLLRVFGEDATELPTDVAPLLPRIIWPHEAAAYDRWLTERPLVGNLGTLHRATHPVEADWPLNAVNAHAAAALGEMGADLVWASPELSGRQLSALVAASPVRIGTVIWGRTELMVSEQCVLQAAGACSRRCASCARRRAWWRLKDQKGYEFPVMTDSTGRSHIMNSVTQDLVRALDEIVAAGVTAVRIDFADETRERMEQVVSAIRSALDTVVSGGDAPDKPLVEPSTSGHFYRGVL